MYSLQSKGEFDQKEAFSEPAQQVRVVFDGCTGDASLVVSEHKQGSKISLMKITWRCPGKPEKEKVLYDFETEFIEKLKSTNTEKSPKIWYVY